MRPSIPQKLAKGIENAKCAAVENVFIPAAAWIMRTPATRWAEMIGGEQTVEFAPDFWDKFIPAAKEGCIPVIVSGPHASDTEMLPMAFAIRDILNVYNEHAPQGKRLKGILMITAASLAEGGQRPGEEIILSAIQPTFLKDRYVEPLFTETDNDKNRRRMEKHPHKFAADLGSLISSGEYGVFVFAESTTDSGRLDNKGKRKGMRQFRQGSVSTHIITIEETTQRNAVVLPVAAIGGEKVYDHARARPSLRMVFAGLWSRNIPKVIHLKFLTPKKSNEEPLKSMVANEKTIKAGTQKGRVIENHFALIIAAETPEEMQGIYKKQLENKDSETTV